MPWLSETLCFVPEEREALGHDGARRGRVWTARELMVLMAASKRTAGMRGSQ